MKHLLPILAAATLVGCSDQEFHEVDYSRIMGELTISGRVCDPERNTWLQGATVYTHLVDDHGNLYASVEAVTDEGGRYLLDRLVSDRTYTVFVQYGSQSLDMFAVNVDRNDVVIDEPTCGSSGSSLVAVITGDYDDYESVLTQVGVGGFDLIDGQVGDELLHFLSDPATLAEYDALFFPGGHREEDVIYDSDGTDSAGHGAAVHAAIRAYVEAGGTVYASDWSYDVVESLWPDMVDFYGEDSIPDDAQVGEEATVTATVVDTGLLDKLGGDKVDLVFDLDAWPVMKYAGDARVYMKGDVPVRVGTQASTQREAPLMVSFPVGEGKVFFTSWRWTANTHGRALESIEYMIKNM